MSLNPPIFFLQVSFGPQSLDGLLGLDDTPTGETDSQTQKESSALIQKLLAKATHPSPAKAVFSTEELESAALAVCQYLASAAAAKRANLGSPTLGSTHENLSGGVRYFCHLNS